jgi:hypothetical protein
MSSLRTLLLAVAIGVGFYLLVFVFFVHKPLTVGTRKAYLDYKLAHMAEHAADRKIAVLAGSNGRFSHRCETIERLTQIACVNMSISAGVSLRWQYSILRPYLKPGDLIYMPLEYRSAGEPAVVGEEAPYIVAYDRKSLSIYDLKQLAHALFFFDLRYLFSATGEMLLAAAGAERRFSTATLTRQGDESGHTSEKALAYGNYLRTAPVPAIGTRHYRDPKSWQDLRGILDHAAQAGIIVVGGLPTLVNDEPIPVEVIEFLPRLYGAHGQCFLILPSHSLYPRRFFYDSIYHLNEEMQIKHSQALAPHLASIMSAGKCASPGSRRSRTGKREPRAK